MAESALLVPVPAAAGVVDRWRARLDPSAWRGVPAHITVLYPFVAPASIEAELVEELADVFASVRSFSFVLETTRWFEDEVLWLEPEPDLPFRRLTKAITRRWPNYRPYGGRFQGVVPHLTIAEGAPTSEMKQAERSISAELPIAALAREVWLMTGSEAADSWSVEATFPMSQAF